MKRILLTCTLLFSMLFSYAQNAREVTIEDILAYPRNHKLENVIVEGYVDKYLQETHETTSYYELRSDYGNTLRVYTGAAPPEVLQWYRVKGMLIYDDQVGQMAVSEVTRERIKVSPKDTDAISEGMPGAKEADAEEDEDEEKDDEGDSNLLLFILIGAGIIVVVLIVLLLVISGSRKSKETKAPAPSAAEAAPQSQAPSAESTPAANEFQTIKIAAATPKTMKFIPGELKIVSGEDAGKSFKIAGYPTPEGNIVSIGREEIKGERAFSHIQLKQQTISRKQAQIISKEGKLYVKNLSETNFTQVDGVELQPGEQVELKPNSTIRTGELEFKYIV